MPNPYDRIVHTPAEKRAEEVRKKRERDFAASMEPISEPPESYYRGGFSSKENYLMNQQFPISHDDEGGEWLTDYTTIAPPPPIDYSQEGGDFLTDVRAAQGWTEPEPEPEETPWYKDLPHVPGLSQVGSTVRDEIFKPAYKPVWDIVKPVMGFMDEYVAQPAGAASTVFRSPSLPSMLGISGLPGWLQGSDAWEFNPEQLPGREGWREKYKENVPLSSRILTEMIADPLNYIPFGLAIKGAKALAKAGKAGEAADVIKRAEAAHDLTDPNSLFYRHVDDTLEEGQQQVIIVSNTYPQGRRITLQAGEDAEKALETARAGQAAGGYKILDGSASRAEVIEASGALLPDASRLLPPPQARGMGARAAEVVGTGRGNIPAGLVSNDVTAFVGKGMTEAEKIDFLASYRRDMPREIPYNPGDMATYKVEPPSPRGYIGGIRPNIGPVVRAVAAPVGLDDAFGNSQLYNIIDGNNLDGNVVAQILIGKTGGKQGAEVKGFWPTIEGGGPGMFSPRGIQSIVRQLGDVNPNLENLAFDGGKLDVRPRVDSQQFVGTPAEAQARRLSESDITTEFAEPIDKIFPRMSSLDATAMQFDEYPYAGINLNRLDIDGMPKTVDNMLTDAQSITPSNLEDAAAVLATTGPRVPGQPLYEMANDIGAYSYLYARAGALLSQATKIPGMRWTAGLWNRAQTLAPDDQIGKLGVDTDVFKSVEHARVRVEVMAWWAKTQSVFGFREIGGSTLLNRPGIWRAQGVNGYDATKVADNPAHGTIDDILKDASRAEGEKVYQLTAEQRQLLDDANGMLDSSLQRNIDAGVDVGDIVDDYFHRILISGPVDKVDSFFEKAWRAVIRPVPTGAAVRKSFQKKRAFDDFEDALKEGYVYDTNPATRLAARLDAGVETFADQSAVNRLLTMKKADGSPMFVSPRAKEILAIRRLGTAKLDDLQRGIQAAKDRLELAKAKFKVAHEAWKADKSKINTDEYRQALAEHAEATSDWLKISKRPLRQAGYFEAYLANHITDIAVRDEVFKKVYIPQVQNARNPAGASGPNLGNIGAKAADVFHLFRALMTNLDLAAMGIQGHVLAFRDFRSWTTAVYESIGAIVKAPYAYVQKNLAIMEEGMRMGAIMRPTEFLFKEGTLGSAPTRIPLLGPAFRGFQRSFEWFIIVGQTEFYKTLRAGNPRVGNIFGSRVMAGERAWAPLGGEKIDRLTPSILKRKEPIPEFVPIKTEEARDAMVEYGRVIRNLMGTEDYAILGIRPTQQTIESTFAFASRFMRANIGLIGAAMRPGVSKQSLAAKQAMMHLLAGGIALTNAIHYHQTGRPANMTDPFAPDWMQVPVGKTYFNTFGPLYPYFRTIARVTNIMVDTQDIGRASNEIKTFANSRASLPFRAAMLAYAGTDARTFEGEEIFAGASPEDIFKSIGLVLGEFTVPIGVSGISEAIGDGRYEGTWTEVIGLTGRASPYSQMDIMFQRLISDPNNPMHQNRLAEGRETTGSYKDASPSEKEWMADPINGFSELHERMIQGARGDYGDAGREWAEQDTKAMVGTDGNGGMIGLSEQLYRPVESWARPDQIQSGDARPVDGAEYRRRLNEIMNTRWIEHQTTANTYGLFQEEQEPPTDKYELALYEYREIMKANTDPVTNKLNFNLLDDALADFEKSKSPEILTYIHNNTGLNRDKTARDLFNDKKVLREYWDKQDSIAESMPPEFQNAVKTWRGMSDVERAKWVLNPAVRTAMEYVNRQMKVWLVQMHEAGDPRAEDFEKKLVMWGYENSPVTPKGQELQRKLLQRLGTEEQMKLPFAPTPESTPSQPVTSMEAMSNGGTSTPQWMQQVLSAR